VSGPVAILLAWLVFAAWARAWHVYSGLADHSPTGEVALTEWVKALVRRDPEPEPDPEPGAPGYRLVPAGGARTAVLWAKRRPVPPPPAEPVPAPRPSRLRRWVAASLERGARPVDIITQGRRQFGVSESTMKREIRRARDGS
jgi:hypothetical protein